MAFVELLGETLLTKEGEKPTAEVLAGKYVGLYFSAHWCPPCRRFTPELAKAYSEHLKAKDLEIVFVSGDRDEEAFKEYYGEMPWLAVPYAKRDLKDKLNKKYKVQGIPSFVVLDQDGSTIKENARGSFSQDPTGKDFPWRPRALAEILDTPLLGKDGAEVHMKSLEDKVVGVYFSGHWCPPCRGFTPQLAEKYKEIKDAGLPFEIIFVSSDRDEEAFKAYHAEMPWLAVPYGDRARKGWFDEHFKVEGIPTLVLLDKDRSVITTNGRGITGAKLEDFPFHPKPVGDLSEPEGINEIPSVVVLAESRTEAEQDSACSAMEPLAKEVNEKAKASGEDPEFKFFLGRSGGGVAGKIRSVCSLPALGEEASKDGNSPVTVLLLDIPDNGGFYASEMREVTTESIRKLLDDYRNKKLERKQLG